MKLTRNQWILLAVLAVLAGAAYYFFVVKKKKDTEEPNNPASATNNPGSPAKETKSDESPVTTVFPLKKGKKGKEVEQYQIWLIKQYGKPALPASGVDGNWQDEVDAATEKYLKKNNISQAYFNKNKMGQIKTTIYK